MFFFKQRTLFLLNTLQLHLESTKSFQYQLEGGIVQCLGNTGLSDSNSLISNDISLVTKLLYCAMIHTNYVHIQVQYEKKKPTILTLHQLTV